MVFFNLFLEIQGRVNLLLNKFIFNDHDEVGGM